MTQYILTVHRTDINGGIINGALSRFNLDREDSIPTWYSQIILFISATVATVIAMHKQTIKDKWRRYWWIVAGVILYASVDEGSRLHEQMNQLALPQRLGIESTYLYLAWVLPALFIISLLFLVLVRFWWKLPKQTKWLLALSVAVFVGGSWRRDDICQFRIITRRDRPISKPNILDRVSPYRRRSGAAWCDSFNIYLARLYIYT